MDFSRLFKAKLVRFGAKSMVFGRFEAARELEEQLEMQKVYRHMVNRLLREQSIMAQKVAMMEQHLERKSREVEAKQSKSRRINEDKVEQIFKLESLEQEGLELK